MTDYICRPGHELFDLPTITKTCDRYGRVMMLKRQTETLRIWISEKGLVVREYLHGSEWREADRYKLGKPTPNLFLSSQPSARAR